MVRASSAPCIKSVAAIYEPRDWAKFAENVIASRDTADRNKIPPRLINKDTSSRNDKSRGAISFIRNRNIIGGTISDYVILFNNYFVKLSPARDYSVFHDGTRTI